MHSSPPVRAPKLQLVIEQPSTGGCWNSPKKKKNASHPKTKKSQWDCRRGVITIKSNPIPTRWMAHKVDNNNTKEVAPLLRGFWTPFQASKSGTWQKDWESQGIWPWRPMRFDYRSFTGPGESKTPILEGTNKCLCAPRPRGKEQWSHRRLNQNYLLVF